MVCTFPEGSALLTEQFLQGNVSLTHMLNEEKKSLCLDGDMSSKK